MQLRDVTHQTCRFHPPDSSSDVIMEYRFLVLFIVRADLRRYVPAVLDSYDDLVRTPRNAFSIRGAVAMLEWARPSMKRSLGPALSYLLLWY